MNRSTTILRASAAMAERLSKPSCPAPSFVCGRAECAVGWPCHQDVSSDRAFLGEEGDT